MNQGGRPRGTFGPHKDEHERAEVKTYVLDGVVYYPHYSFVDHYAAPGGRTISGDRLRALGAADAPRIMWKTKARMR